jgi:hydrogenase maturation protease
MRAGTLVIGIGNPDRGDDGAAALVVRLLGARVRAFVHRGEATALLEAFDGAAQVVLVDACTSGAPPGTVRRFDVDRTPLPADAAPIATHGLDLGQALELARALGRLPPRCTVYAIEAQSFATGAEPGAAVRAAATALAERLADEFAHPCAQDEEPSCTSSG